MSDPIRAAPLSYWRIAEAFLDVLFNLFGAPEDVARQHTLTRKPYLLLLAWLRAGEALLRRLLVIEAAALVATARPGPSRQSKPRQRRLMTFDAEHPEAWRVSFRCCNSSPALRQAQGDAEDAANEERRGKEKSLNSVSLSLSKTDAARFHAAWPLAERYEALIRVFNAPHRFALRLARRLAASLKRAVARIFRCDPQTPNLVGASAFETLDRAALDAMRHFDSS